jgi:hypothetical protein
MDSFLEWGAKKIDKGSDRKTVEAAYQGALECLLLATY